MTMKILNMEIISNKKLKEVLIFESIYESYDDVHDCVITPI